MRWCSQSLRGIRARLPKSECKSLYLPAGGLRPSYLKFLSITFKVGCYQLLTSEGVVRFKWENRGDVRYILVPPSFPPICYVGFGITEWEKKSPDQKKKKKEVGVGGKEELLGVVCNIWQSSLNERTQEHLPQVTHGPKPVSLAVKDTSAIWIIGSQWF